jgi:hypothetical protein
VIGASDAWLARLGETLTARVPVDLIAVPDLAGQQEDAEWDIALAWLSTRSLQPLSDVLAGHRRLGFPEIVAVAEHLHDPAAVALKELGLDRVVPQEVAPEWLSHAALPLASMAAAKRVLRRSREALGELRPQEPLVDPTPVPLSTAEVRFREAYLRALVAQAGSRNEAAALAGIPYRTLCYMLERYGLADAFRGESVPRRRAKDRPDRR